MPSPFPGMNPYLETTDLWPGVHAALIDEIRNRINGTAPPGYGDRVALSSQQDWWLEGTRKLSSQTP